MSIPSNSDFIAFKSKNPTFISSFNGGISINKDRNLFSFGINENGFLGHEEIHTIINHPKQIPNLNKIKMVDCGINHIVCIDYEGNVFTIGNNDKGQLGVGKDKNELPFTHIPQHIPNLVPIDFISSGINFVICITFDGFAYSFGDNEYGQLGIGQNNKNNLSPQLIPDLNDINFIQCRGYHVICKTYSNEYYSWGGNVFGQLGQGHNESCNKPVKCSNWPDNIIDIKCGYYHTLLLTSTGYVYSFGDNRQAFSVCGQLGLNDENIESINIPTLITDIPLIQRIECGEYHSMCIDISDKLWVFGYNEYGQLGLGDTKNRYKPTLNESLHDIIDISSGGNRTFVKTINNKIYAFGNNVNAHHCLLIFFGKEENYQLTPTQAFKDNEDIWGTSTRRSKQKSARK